MGRADYDFAPLLVAHQAASISVHATVGAFVSSRWLRQHLYKSRLVCLHQWYFTKSGSPFLCPLAGAPAQRQAGACRWAGDSYSYAATHPGEMIGAYDPPYHPAQLAEKEVAPTTRAGRGYNRMNPKALLEETKDTEILLIGKPFKLSVTSC